MVVGASNHHVFLSTRLGNRLTLPTNPIMPKLK
jgi:hypothetical protein